MLLGLPVYNLKNAQECSVYSGYKFVFTYFLFYLTTQLTEHHRASVTRDIMMH
jgi:hypothetical protein